jgi:hypothetical protein
MDDPDNQAARVFVGGVTPDIEEQVLIERFSKHGNVNGIIMIFSSNDTWLVFRVWTLVISL